MKTITGFKNQILLVHFLLISLFSMAQVTEEWVARFPTSRTDTEEGAVDLALDSKGNIYVTGSTIGNGTGFDYTIIKYNAAGVLQWVTRYNGPGNATDRAAAIFVDNTNNVYVTGSSEGNGTGSDYATLKLNSSTGAIIWVSRYNGPGDSTDAARALFADNDGNVYVTGGSAGIGSFEDYATIKYGPNGAAKWISRYNGPGDSTDRAVALALDNKGNVLVTGQSIGSGTGWDYATVKYNSSGLQQWAQRYNGAGNNRDFAESVAVDKGGNVYVTGTIVSGLDPSGDPFPLLLLDWGTIKYNAAGAQQWVAIYDEGGDDFAVSVKIDKNGNPYVTGAISNSPPGAEDADEDYGTIKYDPAGNRLWVAKYGPGPDGVGFFPRDQVLDAEGNVYVTGAGNQLAEASYTTVKFDKNGALQWAVDYRNGLSQDARAVEVDDVGNVYVTGNSNIPDCLRCIDFATIKYSQFACGKNGDKFLVCHKGKTTLCLKKSDVEEHLRHGDQLGECPKPDCDVNARISQQSENEAVTAMADRFKVTVAPNPAAGITKIYYELPVDGQVSIQVFDVLGRQIATLINANQQAGLHNTEMDVSPLMNGIYIYRIMVKTAKKSWSETGKINVIK